MKKILLKILLCVLFCCSILFCLTACNNGQPSIKGTEIYSETLTVDNQAKTVYGKLPNGTESYEVSKNIRVADSATYHLCRDILGQNAIVSKTATLKTGDNIYYLIVENNNEIETYILTLRVKPLYKVSFDIQTECFGESLSFPSSGLGYVESQYIEEDSVVVVPEQPNRLGCEFEGWDFDFSQKITKDITIKATWKKNKEMENFDFESDGGSCKITGVLDKKVNCITIPQYVTSFQKNCFSNFNFLEKINFLGTVDDWAEISFEEAILSSTRQLYINESLLIDVVIKNAIRIERYAFDNCTTIKSIKIMDGVKQIMDYAFYGCTQVESVEIAESVNSIGAFVFYGCNSLKHITIPFVGHDGNSITGYSHVLGYIFGYLEETSKNYSTSIPGTTCQYYNGSYPYYTNYHYYIPESLSSVTVLGGKIGIFAFNKCSNIDRIIIQKGNQIRPDAFDGCFALIFYNGNKTDLLKDFQWYVQDNDLTRRKTLFYYSEEKPTDSGKYWHYVNGVPTIWSNMDN